MKLSMWILKRWLEKYNPEAAIEEGDLVLRNVRLYSDNHRQSSNTVYLNQISEDRVMCSSGHDILILSAEDINEVFNEILDAFEYYNDWEESLYEIIRKGAGVKELLNAAFREIPHLMMLADATFYMREYCMEIEDHLEANPEIENLSRERLMPLNIVMRINRDERIRENDCRPYCIPFPEYGSKAAIVNLFVKGVHHGWLVTVLPQGDTEQGELDVLNAFGRILTEWLEKNPEYSAKMEQAGLFLDLLEQGGKAEDMYLRLEEFGWQRTDQMDLYVIRNNSVSENVGGSNAPSKQNAEMDVLERFLRSLSLPSFLLRYEDNILLIVNRTRSGARNADERILSVLKEYGAVAGKSSSVEDFHHFRYYYEAAKTAAYHPPYPGKTLIPVQEAMLPYLLSLIRGAGVSDVRHPALIVLKDYDRQHNTGLYRTLFVFLTANLSYTETARELMIHRSTLIYRMERIEELTNVDLYDYKNRLYLLISYLLDDFSPV